MSSLGQSCSQLGEQVPRCFCRHDDARDDASFIGGGIFSPSDNANIIADDFDRCSGHIAIRYDNRLRPVALTQRRPHPQENRKDLSVGDENIGLIRDQITTAQGLTECVGNSSKVRLVYD